MIRPLRSATGLAAALAILGVGLPRGAREPFAVAAIGVLVAAPLGRVGFLAVRWHQLGDRRFAALALGLLAVVVAGSVAALAA